MNEKKSCDVLFLLLFFLIFGGCGVDIQKKKGLATDSGVYIPSKVVAKQPDTNFTSVTRFGQSVVSPTTENREQKPVNYKGREEDLKPDDSEAFGITCEDSSISTLKEEVVEVKGSPEKEEARFFSLINRFGLSDDEKMFIGIIKKFVTDVNVGLNRGYKTYSNNEFCNLLEKLGATFVKRIVKSLKPTFIALNNAQIAFDKLKESNKNHFQMTFNMAYNGFARDLKSMFNKSCFADIYNSSLQYDNPYSVQFISLKRHFDYMNGGKK
ncbi:BTA121 domain-containing protein surface lipoprotein [Borrelia crocidurae]|uniref:Putative lipoprotein n=1 Tax=Borrelia crocidurae (strain Achema) TaxID=1155096 RepID=I0FEE0_BORCA|nr:hypothetical protein [Borrelia crocidurae]AFI31846.1 Putative lipoprotein [Borrelia crocidurae str. Achema]